MLKMFKGLGLNKKEELPAAEDSSPSDLMPEPVAEDGHDQLDTDGNLEKLLTLWRLKKDLGQSLSPEEVLQISGMEVQELIASIEGRVIEEKIDGAALMSVLEESLGALDRENNSPDNGAPESLMRKAANSKKFRAFFVALMIFLKFAPAQGAEKSSFKTQDRADNLKEIKNSFNLEPDPEKTYQAKAEDFNKYDGKGGEDAKPLKIGIEDGPRFVSLEMAGYFNTDSGELNENVKLEIAHNFQNFLSQITPDNIQDVLNSEFTIYGSSDERQTSNWNGSNEELTLARLAAIEEVLSSVLKSYNFTSLTPDLAKQIQSKTFVQTMPTSSTGPERGVTYLTDLTKDNGENYSAEEIAQIKMDNPELYKQMLDECRKITFSLSVDKSQDIPTMSPKKPSLVIPPPELSGRPWEPSLEKLPDYTNVSLIFDNSPSVGDSYPYISELISKQDFNGLKIHFATFSKKLDAMSTYDNPQEVAKAIKGIKYTGDIEERALTAAESALKKMPIGDKNAVFVVTDEDLQAVSLKKIQELKKLAADKKAEVYFYYADDKNKALRQVSLDDLELGWNNEVFKLASSLVESTLNKGERKIESLEKQKKFQLDITTRLAKRDLSPSLQKSYQLAQSKAAELSAKIDDSRAQIESLRSDWESGSVSRLLANSLMKDFRVVNDQKFSQSLELRVSSGGLGAPALNFNHIETSSNL